MPCIVDQTSDFGRQGVHLVSLPTEFEIAYLDEITSKTVLAILTMSGCEGRRNPCLSCCPGHVGASTVEKI